MFFIDWNGNAWFAGDIYVGSTSGTDRDDGSKKLATEEYVNELRSEVGYLTNLDFDAENIVDAVNKAYSRGRSAYVNGQIVIFSTASVNGKVVIV